MTGALPARIEATAERDSIARVAGKVSLRRFPYPYRAMLAICNDIDCMETVEEFLEIQRFLNTKDSTTMGEGVGLEIGNSFYFYDREGGFSYFGPDERSKQLIVDLVRAGYLDTLHTFGNGATTRAEIGKAMDILEAEGCHLQVWVNHHGARSNISPKFEYMLGESGGDDPLSPAYHTDLTVPYGIRFAWVGALTRIIGQSAGSRTPQFFRQFDRRLPAQSLLNMAKEIRKSLLGVWEDERFTLHRSNELTRVLRLRDGRRVHEFLRYCDHPKGVSIGATSRGLAHVISPRTLEHLKAVGGFMVIYAHLGKNHGCEEVIARETQRALRNLEREHRSGEVCVTTTSRLLQYHLALQHLTWREEWKNGRLRILVEAIEDPAFGRGRPTLDQLQGLTFYVPKSGLAEVWVGGVPVAGLVSNPADKTGLESVTVPFTRLSFPYDRSTARR